jgi:tetratricopeptide (TPR) repeat protein
VIERLHGSTEAAGLLDRLLERRPDLVWCHLRRGILALSAEDWDGAIAHGTAGLALWPSSSTARNILGLAYEGKGDCEAAGAQYRAAIERFPGDLASLFRLGCLLREGGDTSELREEIEILERAHCVTPEGDAAVRELEAGLAEHVTGPGHDLETAHDLELLFRAQRLAPRSWLARSLGGSPALGESEAGERAAD